MASEAGHHRGLRRGHALKGVARELGRANCLLASKAGEKVNRENKRPDADGQLQYSSEPEEGNTNREASKVSASERESEASREGQVAVLAQHSTREGGELRPKESTGGKAKPGRTLYWMEIWETLRGRKP